MDVYSYVNNRRNAVYYWHGSVTTCRAVVVVRTNPVLVWAVRSLMMAGRCTGWFGICAGLTPTTNCGFGATPRTVARDITPAHMPFVGLVLILPPTTALVHYPHHCPFTAPLHHFTVGLVTATLCPGSHELCMLVYNAVIPSLPNGGLFGYVYAIPLPLPFVTHVLAWFSTVPARRAPCG
jgi:hypothetical protein